MAIDAQHPGISADFLVDVREFAGRRPRSKLGLRSLAQLLLSRGVRRISTWKNEASPTNGYRRRIAENLAQTSEEILDGNGRVPHPRAVRHIQPATQIGEPRPGFSIARLSGLESRFESATIRPALGRDLLVEDVDSNSLAVRSPPLGQAERLASFLGPIRDAVPGIEHGFAGGPVRPRIRTACSPASRACLPAHAASSAPGREGRSVPRSGG